MRTLVFASDRKNAGKTTIIMGLAKMLEGKKVGYMKPFGERMVYKKKRLWDYDAAAITKIFNLDENPEDLSMGFDHSKLIYMYNNRETIKEKFLESFGKISKNKHTVFVEGGKDIYYGCSIYLDPFSVANYTDGEIIFIIGGENYEILDEIHFLKNYIELTNNKIKGVIVNKIESMDMWEEEYLPKVENIGMEVLGAIPRTKELETTTVGLIAEQLFAKVIIGEEWLSNEIENIFIGAMSASEALKNPIYNKKKKLIITSGDRTDMILASIEHDTSCLILTNNIIPPQNIVEKARKTRVPLLLVPWDTYTTAKYVENIKVLLNEKDIKKIKLVETLIKEYVKTADII